eukprot:361839-Chlamydomonas_euryale.AAC.20
MAPHGCFHAEHVSLHGDMAGLSASKGMRRPATGQLSPERRCPWLTHDSCSLDVARTAQVGAIVPWNWPFHNLLNPVTAAVFAGNAIVVK